MKRIALVCATGLFLAGCNAASDLDLNMAAYTSCLDQSVGEAPRARNARQAAVQRAFNACKAQEQALVAASTSHLGAEGATKAVADGKAAYARRVVAR
jgi:hypothetical protein